MDSQLCRLCLQISDNVVNIWTTFQDSTIATVLAKHFWFLQINKNDGLTERLCQVCWERTLSFHEFYIKVEELQKSYWDSTKNDGCDDDKNIVADTSDIDSDIDFDKDLTTEKTELNLEATDSQVSEKDDDDYGNESDDNNELADKTPQTDVDRKRVYRIRGASLRQSDDVINKTIREEKNREVNGRIREFYTMKCDLCGAKDFDTLLDIKRHYRQMHQIVGYLKCCEQKFYRRCELLDHIRQHLRDPEIAKMNAKIYEWFIMKCDTCDNVPFKTLLNMRRHFRTVHNAPGYLICSCCSKKFVTRYSMEAHIRALTNPDAFHCEQCDRSFSTQQSLKNHIAHHVPLDSRAFKCNLCSSSFAREAILKVHIRNKHTSKNGQKFPCEKCNKNYSSALLLKCHIRQSHETLRNYVCELCARQFKSKQILRYHFTSEHSSEPEPRVQCDICGNWLKNKNNLTRHKREQHSDSEPMDCHICNKTMSSKLRLRQHVSYVHGEKRHRCTFCVKSFHSPSALKEHVATHTGEDLYNCHHCDKKFKSSGNLSAHMKKSHYKEWSRNSKKTMNAKN